MFNASEFATNNRGKLVRLTRHEGVVIGYNPKENLVIVFVGDASALKWSDSVIIKHNCHWFVVDERDVGGMRHVDFKY